MKFTRFTKRGLAAFYGIALLLLIVSAYVITFAKAPAPAFTMRVISENHDLISHEAAVGVVNMDPLSAQPFSPLFFIQDTSFDKSKIHDIQIFEYKPLPVTYFTYDSRTIQISHNAPLYRNNATNVTYIDPTFELPQICSWISNVTYACPFNETYVNGSVVKNTLSWKPTKMVAIMQPDKVSASYGNVNIPKYNAKTKIDDFGNQYDINGEKLFKITWKTPPAYRTAGSGYWGVADANTNISYDPWWNSNWQYKSIISVTETAGFARNNETISLSMSNIAGFNRADVQSDCDDIRVVNYTSQTEMAFTNMTCNATAVVLEFPCRASALASNFQCAEIYWGNAVASLPTTDNSLAITDVAGGIGVAGWNITYGHMRTKEVFGQGAASSGNPRDPIFENVTGWGIGAGNMASSSPGIATQIAAQPRTVTNITYRGLFSIQFGDHDIMANNIDRNITFYDTGKALMNESYRGTTAPEGYNPLLIQFSSAQYKFVKAANVFTYGNGEILTASGLNYFGAHEQTTGQYVAFIVVGNNTMLSWRYYLNALGVTPDSLGAPSEQYLIIHGRAAADGSNLQTILDAEYNKAHYPLTVSAGAATENIFAPSIDNMALVPAAPNYMNVTTCRVNVTNGGENVVSMLFNVTLTTNSSTLFENNGTTPYAGGAEGYNWTTGNFQPSVSGTNIVNCTVRAIGATFESAKTTLFTVSEAAPSLFGTVSPANPFYTSQANFVCNYTTGAGGLPANTKIAGATMYLNLDGYNRTMTEETNGYTYTNSTAYVGNHDWYCLGYKTNYRALTTGTSSVTIQNNPPTINSISTSPTVPIFGYNNIQVIVESSDLEVGVTSQTLNWTWPNGTVTNIDNLTLAVPGTGNWTSSNFTIGQFGVYSLNTTACDALGGCSSLQTTFAVLMNRSTTVQTSPVEVGSNITIKLNYTKDANFTSIQGANTKLTIYNYSASREVLSTNLIFTYIDSLGLYQYNYTPTFNGTYVYNVMANLTSTTFGSYVDLNGTFDTKDTTNPVFDSGISTTWYCFGTTKVRLGYNYTFSWSAGDNWAINASMSYCRYELPNATGGNSSVTNASGLYSCLIPAGNMTGGTANMTVVLYDYAKNVASLEKIFEVWTKDLCSDGTGGGPSGGGGGGASSGFETGWQAYITNITRNYGLGDLLCQNPIICSNNTDCCGGFECGVNATSGVGFCYKPKPPPEMGNIATYCEKNSDCNAMLECSNNVCIPSKNYVALGAIVVGTLVLMQVKTRHRKKGG